jgi:hypothetical protein
MRIIWEDNIKVDHKEVSCKGAGWINVVQVRDKWWVLLNTVKVSYNAGITAELVASQGLLCL